MERYDHNETSYPSWIEECGIFFFALACCAVLAYAGFKFAQFVGWLPKLWWL